MRYRSLTSASLRGRLPWSTEEQDVAVRVANLEPAKTVVGILQRHAEDCSITGKFDGERIRSGAWTQASHGIEGLRFEYHASLSTVTSVG